MTTLTMTTATAYKAAREATDARMKFAKAYKLGLIDMGALKSKIADEDEAWGTAYETLKPVNTPVSIWEEGEDDNQFDCIDRMRS